MKIRSQPLLRLICCGIALGIGWAFAPQQQQPLHAVDGSLKSSAAVALNGATDASHNLRDPTGQVDAAHAAQGRGLALTASLAGAGAGTSATAGGTADAIMKNTLIVIAAVSLGILVAIATVSYMLWKSGLLSMFSKAQGIPDPMGFVPTEATDLATEVGGAPSAPPDEKKK